MADAAAVLAHWELDARQVRDRMYRAPTPRERERWHALWLLAQGWSANKVADLLERDAHTIGGWLAAFERDGPAALAFAQTGGPLCCSVILEVSAARRADPPCAWPRASRPTCRSRVGLPGVT